MSFVNYTRREDAQDDTLKFMAECLFRSAQAIRERDAAALFTECNILYLTFRVKLKGEKLTTASDLMNKTRASLYSVDGRARTSRELSIAFENAQEFYGYLCMELIKEGILLSLETDLDAIVARRSA